MALPIPRLAPVISATRPVRSKLEPSGTTDTIGRRMAVSGKAAEDILERIFQPTTKPSARDQAEETLRHPKRLVYVAMSNKVFYWRAPNHQFVPLPGIVPGRPPLPLRPLPLPPACAAARARARDHPAPP